MLYHNFKIVKKILLAFTHRGKREIPNPLFGMIRALMIMTLQNERHVIMLFENSAKLICIVDTVILIYPCIRAFVQQNDNHFIGLFQKIIQVLELLRWQIGVLPIHARNIKSSVITAVACIQKSQNKRVGLHGVRRNRTLRDLLELLR